MPPTLSEPTHPTPPLSPPPPSSFYGPGMHYSWVLLMTSYLIRELSYKRTRRIWRPSNAVLARVYFTIPTPAALAPESAGRGMVARLKSSWESAWEFNFDLFAILLYPAVAACDLLLRIYSSGPGQTSLEPGKKVAEPTTAAISRLIWTNWFFFSVREFVLFRAMEYGLLPRELYPVLFRSAEWRLCRFLSRALFVVFALAASRGVWGVDLSAGVPMMAQSLGAFCLCYAIVLVRGAVWAGIHRGLWARAAAFDSKDLVRILKSMARALFTLLVNDFQGSLPTGLAKDLEFHYITLTPPSWILMVFNIGLVKEYHSLGDLDQAVSLAVGLVTLLVRLVEFTRKPHVFGRPTRLSTADVDEEFNLAVQRVLFTAKNE